MLGSPLCMLPTLPRLPRPWPLNCHLFLPFLLPFPFLLALALSLSQPPLSWPLPGLLPL